MHDPETGMGDIEKMSSEREKDNVGEDGCTEKENKTMKEKHASE